MKIYLVGGAVRDALLGRDIHERDWVVVGATEGEMKRLGYKRVGKDFPVFLHPKSGEEYALARTERKTARGYTGFECDANPDITLEQDLARRDLTINAMAQDENGQIIDPFEGQLDIASKQLRHVSDAFREDPLRVLRVARFAARYADQGFSVAAKTQALMQQIVDGGELADLVPERIWKETSRALMENSPDVYLKVLKSVGALQIMMPELDQKLSQNISDTNQTTHYDCVLDALRFCAAQHWGLDVRVAVLCYPLANAGQLTSAGQRRSQADPENPDSNLIQHYAQRLAFPATVRDLAALVNQNYELINQIEYQSAEKMVDFLQRVDAFRRPQRFQCLLQAITAIHVGIDGIHDGGDVDGYRVKFLSTIQSLCTLVEAKTFIQQGITGKAIGEAVRQERILRVQAYLEKQ